MASYTVRDFRGDFHTIDETTTREDILAIHHRTEFDRCQPGPSGEAARERFIENILVDGIEFGYAGSVRDWAPMLGLAFVRKHR